MTIQYSTKAESDIAAISDYLFEQFGDRTDREKITQLYKDINFLAENPFYGKAIFDNMRKLNSGPSVIIYEVRDKIIEILHVVDGRTDYMKTIFG